MTNNPFSVFTTQIYTFGKYFTISNIQLNFIYLFLILVSICFLARINNFFYNMILSLWNLLYNMLDIDHHLENKKHLPFFFVMTLIVIVTNFIGRLPIFFPLTSLLKIAIPFYAIMFSYFIYASFSKNKLKIIKIFFNDNIILPLRIFLGILEIFSYGLKPVIFAFRSLAAITAGHILIWVIESLINASAIYLKIFPFFFLILIYFIEFCMCILQSYMFIILSTNIFKSIQNPH